MHRGTLDSNLGIGSFCAKHDRDSVRSAEMRTGEVSDLIREIVFPVI